MERLPVIIGGETVGYVELRREGAYVLCSGRLRRQMEMVRLWVHGSGAPGYLGVLVPDGAEWVRLRKRFSMRDFAHLPHPLTHCSTEQGQPAAEADVYWYACGDGTLTRVTEEGRLVAFPAEAVRLPAEMEGLLRMIEGKQYIIFPG